MFDVRAQLIENKALATREKSIKSSS